MRPDPTPIRAAREADAPAIAGLLNPIIAAGAYTIMVEPITVSDQIEFIRSFPERGVYHVAVGDGSILGIQDVQPISAEPALAHVGEISTFVALDARRRGVGRALMNATLAAVRARGFLKLTAAVRADNPEALAFYRAQGFEEVGRLRRHALVRHRLVDEALLERQVDGA